MMESRHHNRRVEQAEQSREDYAEGGHQTTVNHIGDAVSDFPADGAYHRMGDDHRRNQGAEGHHNHAHHFRAVLLEELLQIHQHEACHDGGDYLSLITNLLHLKESEVPYRNIRRRRSGYGKSV